MADFNHKKLQVFVSSTFIDLTHERQAAVEAILTAGHIPAGMELFTSGDESQMEVIKQWIDESDVYLLILGGRYGSIEPKSEKSYVHLEYEYALSKGKPLFACAIDEKAIEPRAKREGLKVVETENPQKLKEFRAEVLTRIVRFWEDSKDIKLAIMETLSGLARREELAGWVRSTTQSNVPALADEVARLSKENAGLRDKLSTSTQETFTGLTFAELKAVLEKSNLLKFLRDKRSQFAVGVDGTGAFSGQIRELTTIGIVVHKTAQWYILTDSGRAFLNKLEILEPLKSSDSAAESGPLYAIDPTEIGFGLKVTADITIAGAARVVRLSVKAVNAGLHPVNVEAARVLLENLTLPMPGHPSASVKTSLNEIILYQKPAVVEIKPHGGVHTWETIIGKDSRLKMSEKNGERYGNGYLKLTSGKKIEFQFLCFEMPNIPPHVLEGLGNQIQGGDKSG